jgi:hypothetical protein
MREQRIAEVRWFVRCAAGAGLLLCAAGLAAAWIGNGVQLPSTTARDGSLITLNRYVYEPIPDVALVGSSLTFRLKEEYFGTPRVRNLALAGGSPLTGLAIIANRSRVPPIVVVETNVLSRSMDIALVEKYSKADNGQAWFARPIRSAVALYENWMHAPPTREQAVLTRARLLDQPPAQFDNRVYVDRAFQQLDAEEQVSAVKENAERIRLLAGLLEQRGARVLFLEVPYMGRIEEARSVKATRAIVHAAFPEPDRWLPLAVDRNELRWADGVHLDERSALIVSQAVDDALKALPPAVSPTK